MNPGSQQQRRQRDLWHALNVGGQHRSRKRRIRRKINKTKGNYQLTYHRKEYLA